MWSLRGRAFSFFYEVKVRGHAQEIDKDSNNIPRNNWPRQNQKSVINPQYLEDTYDRRHPRVYARSGTTAKHCKQVRDGSKCCAQARDKTKDFRSLKLRDEKALRVPGN